MEQGGLGHDEGPNHQSAFARSIMVRSSLSLVTLSAKRGCFLRGVAGHFLRPMMASFFQSVRAWWSKGGMHSSGPKPEGQGVGKLRTWVEGLTAPGAVRHDLSK